MGEKWKRMRDSTWDFADVREANGIHDIHPYPAMMLPQIARRLVEKYLREGGVFLDPFCGSGTVLVESLRKSNIGYGIDINPLAILISKVKISKLPVDIIGTKIHEFGEKIRMIRWGEISLPKEIPELFNITYWFKERNIYELNWLKKEIDSIDNNEVKDFFTVAFSATIRKVSLTRKGEYKLFRMPERRIKKWNVDALKEFLSVSNRNLKLYTEFWHSLKKDASKNQIKFFNDSVENVEIEKELVDFLATSPPYGDSKTTVAYGQFSRLSLQWIGIPYNRIKLIDKMSLGGKKRKITSELPSEELYKLLENISKLDERRAEEVFSFFHDLYHSIRKLDVWIKPGGYSIFVVGNRTVKGVRILLDLIILDFFKNLNNYEHLGTVVREIPSKRLPRKSSPTNKKGEKVETMNHEYIVILKKMK